MDITIGTNATQPDPAPPNINGSISVNDSVSELAPAGPSLILIAINVLLAFTVLAFVINVFLWLGAHGDESQSSRAKFGMTMTVIATLIELLLWTLVTWFTSH